MPAVSVTPAEEFYDLLIVLREIIIKVIFFLFLEKRKKSTLCQLDRAEGCEDESGSFSPQVILFLAQVIGGVGGSLYYSLGVSYMDDNIQKSKTPVLISEYRNEIYFGYPHYTIKTRKIS